MINKKRLLATFLDYATIDSESNHEKNICDHICKQLAALGYSFRHYQPLSKYPSDGYTIGVTVEGDRTKEGLVLAAHLDTVIPGKNVKPHLCEDGYIRSDGTTVLGSDDKSGVASLMELLRTLRETNTVPCPLQIFFTIQEEIGTIGAQSIPKEDIAFSQAIVLDSSGDVGRVVTSSPGRMEIKSTVLGKAAHAGNFPEKGISALSVMSKAISKMHLQRIDNETTANVGSFLAPGVPNIVNDKASIVAEIRSRNSEKLRREEQHMHQCLLDACKESGAELQYEIVQNSAGYQIPQDAPVLKRLEQACQKCGIHFFTAASGGGSDANVFNEKGMTAVNISTGMEKVHTKEEQMSVKNLEQCATLLWEIVTA